MIRRRAWMLMLASLTAGAAGAQVAQRVPVIAGNGFVKVLVEIDGTVKVWGRTRGNLSLGAGDAKSPEIKEPRALSGVGGIANASVGDEQVLLLTRQGTVIGWGSNSDCELGTGDFKRSYTPVAIEKLRSVKQIVAGKKVSGAVLEDGTVWMWGFGQRGHMGDGTWGYLTQCTPVPKEVAGMSHVTQLAIGEESVLALKDDGTVWGWGTNGNGELCDGTRERRLRPVQLKGIAGAVAIAVDMSSVIVLADGTIRMCGRNDLGSLGDASAPDNVADTHPKAYHLSPFKVPGIAGARSARTNGHTTIVHLKDGTLRAWGMGYWGALGDGNGEGWSVVPRAPRGVGPVLVHYMANFSSYAIRSDGTVMAWSVPSTDGRTENVLVPKPLFKLTLGQP